MLPRNGKDKLLDDNGIAMQRAHARKTLRWVKPDQVGLAGHDDSKRYTKQELIITIELPTHLFDCTNCLASSSSSVYNPRLDANHSIDQARFRLTSRQTNYSRSSNSDGEPPSGTSHFAQSSNLEKAFETVEYSGVWNA